MCMCLSVYFDFMLLPLVSLCRDEPRETDRQTEAERFVPLLGESTTTTTTTNGTLRRQRRRHLVMMGHDSDSGSLMTHIST